MGKLDTLVQQKLEADTDFQNSLADLSDEDKNVAIEAKKVEILDEFYDSSEKNRELADNYKTRAVKAEEKLKEVKPLKDKSSDDLSQKDYAFLFSKVHEDDVDEVVKAMRALGLKDPREALKDRVVSTLITTNEEHRKTAQASNVSTVRSSTKKLSGAELLAKVRSGEAPIPEKGSIEAEEIFWAKRGGRKS